MRLKVGYKGDGPGPSEKIVSIKSHAGTEQIVLSQRKLSGEWIEVGDPLADQEGLYLIELPRETASGRWRIWVPHSELEDSEMIAAE